MQALLKNGGVNIDEIDEDLHTPLHHAAKVGDFDLVNMIITYGANLQIKSKSEQTALHHAVSYKKLDVVKLLIKSGADIEAKDEKQMTPLHYAAIVGNTRITKFLLESGAELNALSHNGSTALHCAASWDKVGVVKLLIKHMDINTPNSAYTPLHQAVSYGFLRTIECLIQNGADVNAKGGPDFTTPLNGSIYAETNVFQMVKILVRNGANVNASTRTNLQTALHACAWKGYEDISEFLITNGAKVNATDRRKVTALHLAVTYNHTKLVKTLIKCGANVDAKSSPEFAQFTPIETALNDGKLEITKLILFQIH